MKLSPAQINVGINLSVEDINLILHREGYTDSYKTAKFVGWNGHQFVYEMTYWNAIEGLNETGALFVTVSENLHIDVDY